jgi:hypothetical protein
MATKDAAQSAPDGTHRCVGQGERNNLINCWVICLIGLEHPRCHADVRMASDLQSSRPAGSMWPPSAKVRFPQVPQVGRLAVVDAAVRVTQERHALVPSLVRRCAS